MLILLKLYGVSLHHFLFWNWQKKYKFEDLWYTSGSINTNIQATQGRLILLYVGHILFVELIPQKYLEHFQELSCCLALMLGHINDYSVEWINERLRLFVETGLYI